MQPTSIVFNAANSGEIVPLNYDNVSVGIAFGCTVTGTVNYTVNHTYTNVFNPALTPKWWAHGVSNMVNATTSQESNFVLPVAAMQIVINSGSGSVLLELIQEGII